jgi:hypothetical protein
LPFLSYLWVGSRKTLEVDVKSSNLLGRVSQAK